MEFRSSIPSLSQRMGFFLYIHMNLIMFRVERLRERYESSTQKERQMHGYKGDHRGCPLCACKGRKLHGVKFTQGLRSAGALLLCNHLCVAHPASVCLALPPSGSEVASGDARCPHKSAAATAARSALSGRGVKRMRRMFSKYDPNPADCFFSGC